MDTETGNFMLEMKVCQYQPALQGLLKHLQAKSQTNDCPDDLRKLLTSLAQDSPVCALVPPEQKVLKLMSALEQGANPIDDPNGQLR